VVRHDDAYLFVHWQRPHAPNAIALMLELVRQRGQRHRRTIGSLTKREQAVLRWLAAGKTNREIAEILVISPSTVGKHLERIYEKLGVENRTAAASFYGG
jgi:DNA-binding NarL/FixJ family response regulator